MKCRLTANCAELDIMCLPLGSKMPALSHWLYATCHQPKHSTLLACNSISFARAAASFGRPFPQCHFEDIGKAVLAPTAMELPLMHAAQAQFGAPHRGSTHFGLRVIASYALPSGQVSLVLQGSSSNTLVGKGMVEHPEEIVWSEAEQWMARRLLIPMPLLTCSVLYAMECNEVSKNKMKQIKLQYK